MPHFVIDCSERVVMLRSAEALIRAVHDAAGSTGLFRPEDIKVRIRPYALYTVAGTMDDFIHVFASVMEGRSVAQRHDLSRRIIAVLTGMFPQVPVISMNVDEFERATYCNRTMI
jgi:5-carboxymethyl-2-hydroxymuconate isomerase